jgi:integrase
VRFKVDGHEFRYGFDKKALADEFADRLQEHFAKGCVFDPAARRFIPPGIEEDTGPTFVEHTGEHYRRKWPTWAPSRRRDAQWALSLACLHLVEPEAPQLDGGQRLEANAYLRRMVLVPEVPETINTEDHAWQAWFDRWSLPLRAITDAHLHGFLETARTTALDGTHRVLAPGSVAALRTIVRATFTAARKRRLIVWDPWDAVEWKAPQDEEQVDPDLVLSPQQVLAMARACGTRHRRYESYILVQGFCGLRPGEARELSRRDFDLEATPATVTTCGTYTDVSVKYLDEGESRDRPLKGRGPKARRAVPVPAELVPYFQRHLDEFVPRRPDALVFTTVTGRRINSKNFHRDTWAPARQQLFEEGNPLRRVRQHDLRHAAATHWLNSGVLPKTAQQWTGHRRLSVLLDIYVGVMREDAATSLARVEASLNQVLDGTETAHEP